MYPILAVVGAYLLGSLSFAVIVTRVMGLNDPRTYGSKNPGATNVLRSGSKPAAVATLFLDAVKGWLPVFLVLGWGQHFGLGFGTAALVGLAAFAGHLWPVFFRFQGGKGVATALGVLMGVSSWLGLLTLLVWVAVAAIWRYSSLAALVAAAMAPLLFLLFDGVLWLAATPLTLVMVVMTLLLAWRHRENIRRLKTGAEPRLGKSKAAAP
jgi:acyl phosphate:glycerol-3-phosphate acyltransferase